MSSCGERWTPAERITSLPAESVYCTFAVSTSTPFASNRSLKRIFFARVDLYTVSLCVAPSAGRRKAVSDELRVCVSRSRVNAVYCCPIRDPETRSGTWRNPSSFRASLPNDENEFVQFGYETCTGPSRPKVAGFALTLAFVGRRSLFAFWNVTDR